MRAGKLDRRITIQRKTVTQSASGAPIETWATITGCDRRASSAPRPVRGDEKFSAPELAAKSLFEFRIRYSSNIAALSPLDRIIYPALDAGAVTVEGTRIYDIAAVVELGRREGLSIIAMVRPDVLAVQTIDDGSEPSTNPLDTQAKRMGAIDLALPWRPYMPIPDGTIDVNDRKIAGRMYPV